MINNFYRWARKTNRFIPAPNFTRKNGKSARDKGGGNFEVLTLEQSREAYDRISKHADPVGRFLAFMALLYSQSMIASRSLRRSDLTRHEGSNCWSIKRGDAEFELEEEVSAALDECLVLADKHSRDLGQNEEQYIFPGRKKHCISNEAASKKIRDASGQKGTILRRTGVVNMYRGGQKTIGTIVLRDTLKVSVPVIHNAIRLVGHSVNAPFDKETAEAYRRAFLEQDD
jgi:hypothetical protein